MTRLLPLLAPLLGFLVAWFLWGAPLPWLLLVLLGGAALWTLAPRQGQGGWTFSRSFFTVVLLGLSLWLLGAGVTGILLVLSPDNPLPINGVSLVPLLLAGAGGVAACWAMIAQMVGRASREKGQVVVLPWLWMAGMLAFAAFPPVRVDCRGLERDRWLAPDSGFSGEAGQSPWATHPERIPRRHQLPARLSDLRVTAAATRCTADAQGRPRFPGFRASHPLILVQLSELGGGKRTFHAAFMPGNHRQLTDWQPGKWQAFRSASLSGGVAWPGLRLAHHWPESLPQPR